MRESLRIIKQALAALPGGPVSVPVPLALRPDPGSAYVRIESPKGELGFYLVSDGSSAPYRFHVRSPSYINLTALKDMVVRPLRLRRRRHPRQHRHQRRRNRPMTSSAGPALLPLLAADASGGSSGSSAALAPLPRLRKGISIGQTKPLGTRSRGGRIIVPSLLRECREPRSLRGGAWGCLPKVSS